MDCSSPPTISPDLVPSDFNLFGALKDVICWKRFGNDEVTEEVAMSAKFKMVQGGDRLSSAGAKLLQLMKTAYRHKVCMYEGWNFNSGNYLFTTGTK